MAFMRTNILQFPWSHLRSELFSLYDGKRLPQELSLLWSASFFNDSCGPKDGCLASHLHLHKDTSFPAQLRAWMHSSNRFLGDWIRLQVTHGIWLPLLLLISMLLQQLLLFTVTTTAFYCLLSCLTQSFSLRKYHEYMRIWGWLNSLASCTVQVETCRYLTTTWM